MTVGAAPAEDVEQPGQPVRLASSGPLESGRSNQGGLSVASVRQSSATCHERDRRPFHTRLM
jgi:hypothetical protein